VPESTFRPVWGVAVAGLLMAGAAASMAAVKPAAAVKQPAATHTIVIENMRFEPQTLTVRSGDRIVWINKDLVPHTATADAKAFDSRSIDANASWSFVAGETGSYTYTCAFHPTMKGTLTVQ